MGLFDKFSKKNKNTAEDLAEKAEKLIDDSPKQEEKPKESEEKTSVASEKKAEEPEVKDQKTQSSDPERRFTIMVEDVFQLKDDLGIVAGGNVHGTMNIHDKVFILHPLLPQGVEAEIDGIEEGPTNMVETATDSRVGVRFTSLKKREDIPKFSVITNIRPQSSPSPSRPAEGPYLLGLSYEYNRLINDRAFANIFTFAVFSGRYITPVKIDAEPEKTADGKAVLRRDSKVAFRLLRHPNDESLHVLPVFTDWAALKMWKNAFDDEEQPKTFFMSFEQCADIGLKNGGFVINAFGPAPVFVSNDNIKMILEMKKNLDQKIDEEKKSSK